MKVFIFLANFLAVSSCFREAKLNGSHNGNLTDKSSEKAFGINQAEEGSLVIFQVELLRIIILISRSTVEPSKTLSIRRRIYETHRELKTVAAMSSRLSSLPEFIDEFRAVGPRE